MVKYDDGALRRELDRLLRSGRGLEPAMREIAGHLANSVAESFERQAGPDGAPWKPLKDKSVKERCRKGSERPKRIVACRT